MSKSNFFDFIWKTNSILIFLVFLALLFSLTFEKLPKLFTSNQTPDKGVIVGSKRQKAIELDIDLQHLIYTSIEKIWHSDYYLAEVVVIDKEIPDYVKDQINRANDYSIYNLGTTVNIVFFNENRTDTHKLLDTYGYIESFTYPGKDAYLYSAKRESDKRNFILYKIAMRDTDKDGRINSKDSTAFFISDLSGKNLKQITPYSLEFNKYFFSRDNEEIYFELLKKHEEKDILGYYLKSRSLYYYSFKTDKFGKFEELDEILSSIKKDFIQK